MDTKTTSRSACNQMEQLLRENPLFSRLTDEQLQRMCRFSKVIDLKEGEILFNHGDRVENFYFVYQGLIKLYRLSAVGHEKIFELESAGSTFAEALMFFDLAAYPVSAAAMKRSTLVAISTRKFLGILKESADTSLMIMGDLSRRLHELVNEIEHLSLLTGRNRVATYFLDQTMNKGNDFKLDIPKNAIASMLSLQPETFSRLLKELCQTGVLEVQDCNIRIVDQDKLRQQAGIN